MQQTNPILRTARGPLPLAILLAIPALLVFSWLWGPTRESWDALDLLVFRTLNQTLSIGVGWQKLWAFLNSRVFDAIAGMILLALLITGFREQKTGKLAIASLVLMALATLAGREVGSRWIVENWLDYQRPSPTLVIANSQRLTELVPSIETKDSSPWSFPGDHGMVVLSVALYMSFWSRKRTVQSVWLLSVLILLPRLVSGGHWLTDIVIGSLSMAMVSIGLLMGTGWHDKAVARIGNALDTFSSHRSLDEDPPESAKSIGHTAKSKVA